MNEFLSFSQQDKSAIIYNTANKFHMPEAIIEKDFWVCWLLDYLFNDFQYKDFICFKGGTSLSKVYHCIDRFSEDIDLALDWSIIGILKDDAYDLRSHRQQDFFNKDVIKKTEDYLLNIWLPLIKEDLKSRLNEQFELYIDESNLQTICFQYPRIYDDSSILQVIRLEVGILAEPVPSSWKYINTYMADIYPELFETMYIKVKVVDIVRTFFEKVTILHREAKRTNGNYPARYSRHYYDVYQMIEKGIAKDALQHLEIMEKVVQFKKRFYPYKWAEYDEVLKGECQFIPSEEAVQAFSKDYDFMKKMFYRQYPSFTEIIETLGEYEVILNHSIRNRYIAIT